MEHQGFRLAIGHGIRRQERRIDGTDASGAPRWRCPEQGRGIVTEGWGLPSQRSGSPAVEAPGPIDHLWLCQWLHGPVTFCAGGAGQADQAGAR